MTDVRPVGIPSDTSIEAWKMEMAAVRRMTPEQRAAGWFEFQCAIDEMAFDAVRRKYPDASHEFRLKEFVRRSHGAELADAAFPVTRAI